MKRFSGEAIGYIKDMFVQHNMVKRSVISALSILIMGFGISLFSVSGFGVDPYTSMNMNIAYATGIRFGTVQLIMNICVLLFVVIVAHRGLVGVGTVFNMVGCGYVCELFEGVFTPILAPYYDLLAVRIVVLCCGIVVLCFACSLFFVANVGVGPYDALSFMLSGKSHMQHKWARVLTDITVVTIGLVVSGGLQAALHGNFGAVQNIGLGTIITAFCMGPLINFFSKHVSSKILDVDYEKISKDVAFFMIRGAMLKNSAPAYVEHQREVLPENVAEKKI